MFFYALDGPTRGPMGLGPILIFWPDTAQPNAKWVRHGVGPFRPRPVARTGPQPSYAQAAINPSNIGLIKKLICFSLLNFQYMPKSVVRAQNMKNKESVVLRDPEGKCWPLEVKKITGDRIVVARGWAEFWKGYGISNGDLLEFKFASEYLIHLNIKPSTMTPLEPDVEDAVVCYNEEALAIEPGAVITREEFDAAIQPTEEAVVMQEEFAAATTTNQPEVNDIIY